MVKNNRTPAREADEIIETETSRVQYHRSDETYLAEYEWGTDQSLSATLAVLLETKSDADSTDRPPLFDRVDTDALDRLFEPTGDEERDRRAGRIVFPYCECLVTVHADGEIVIPPNKRTQRDNERHYRYDDRGAENSRSHFHWNLRSR